MVGFQIVFRMLLLESFDMTLMDTASTALFSLICCHPVSALPVFLLVCNSGGGCFLVFFAVPLFCADFDDVAPTSLLPAPPPTPSHIEGSFGIVALLPGVHRRRLQIVGRLPCGTHPEVIIVVVVVTHNSEL